jgi:hypothetical protein
VSSNFGDLLLGTGPGRAFEVAPRFRMATRWRLSRKMSRGSPRSGLAPARVRSGCRSGRCLRVLPPSAHHYGRFVRDPVQPLPCPRCRSVGPSLVRPLVIGMQQAPPSASNPGPPWRQQAGRAEPAGVSPGPMAPSSYGGRPASKRKGCGLVKRQLVPPKPDLRPGGREHDTQARFPATVGPPAARGTTWSI